MNQMKKLKELEQKLLRKIYRKMYRVPPEYSIDFKWHIFLPRFIILIPFYALQQTLEKLLELNEAIMEFISSLFPQFYTFKKKTDK